jgi:tetratricopeptide (TPR) repeat protein
MADEASKKAVALDDSSSDAHMARANALGVLWKWSEAGTEFQRAIELNPNNANAHYFYAFNYLMPMNRLDESHEEFLKALSLDPLASIVRTNYALSLAASHKFSDADAQFNQVLERDPTFGPAIFYQSQVLATEGKWPEAVATFRKGAAAGQLTGTFSPDPTGFLEIMRRLGPNDTLAANTAVAYALGGDREKAFEYLDKAYAQHDDELTAVIRFPAFDSLHSDPRWAALLKKLNLPL